jgi:hypothetical protein
MRSTETEDGESYSSFFIQMTVIQMIVIQMIQPFAYQNGTKNSEFPTEGGELAVPDGLA